MAENRPFLIFLDSFLNFCKANKNCDYLANFQNCCKISLEFNKTASDDISSQYSQTNFFHWSL